MSKLDDLVDISLLQKLQDRLSAVTGLPIGIVDPEGNPITQISGNQRFCELILGSDAGFKACYKAVKDNLAKSPGAISEYKCEAELYHLATPILVGGSLLGNIVVGQLQREKLSKEKIKQLAEEYGISFEELLEAGRDLTTYSKTKAQQVTSLLAAISSAIGTQASLKTSIKQYSEQLEEMVEERTKQLSESEEKYRGLVESSTDAIISIDEGGVITLWNKTAENIFGYSEGEAVGKPVTLIMPEEYKDLHEKSFARFLRFKKPKLTRKKYEVEGLRKDGSRFPIELSLSGELGDDHYTFTAILRDVTERKKMEQRLIKFAENLEKKVEERTKELTESEEKYRLSIDKSQDAIFAIDVDTAQIIDANLKAEELTGYSKEELLKLKGWDVHPVEEKEGCQEKMRQVIEGGGVTCEMVFLRKDGSTVPADISSSLIEYGDKKFIQRICRDITKRKKAEEKLRQAQQNYEALINSIDGIVWEADARTFQFSFVSEQAKRLLGYPLERWLTEPTFWKDHIHPDDQDWAVAYCTRATTEKKPHEFEYRMIAADGRLVWLRDIVTVTVENDRPVKLRGVMVDITERKRAEEEVQRRTKELKETKDFLDNVIESSADSIITTNLDGEITSFSRGAEEIFRYKAMEVVGASISNLYSEELRDASLKWVERVKRGEKIRNLRVRALGKNGRPLYIDLSLSPMMNEKGEPIGTVGVSKDITKVIELEREMMETKDFLQNVVDSASEMIFSLDKNRHISSWNRGAELITGYKQKEVMGKGLSEFGCFDIGEMAERIDESLEKGRTDDFETAVKSRGGRRKVLRLSISQLKDSGGALLGFVAMGRDVTLSRRMEERLIPGNSYLIKARSSMDAYSILEGLTSSGFKELVVTRTNPANIKSTYKLDAYYLWMSSEKSQDFESVSEFPMVVEKVRRFISENPKCAVLIDRIDYLITIHDFREFLTTLYRLNDLISVSDGIMIVNAVESVLTPQQFNLLEQEIQTLPRLEVDRGTELSYGLYEILSFVHDNEDVRLKDISGRFSITRPTVNKRVKILEERGLIDVVAKGRTKILKITELGRKSL